MIDYIYLIYGNWKITDWFYNNAIKLAESFEKRIEELESNPPLKFEELEKGMWVWVKDMHKYQQITRVFIDESVFIKGHGIRMVETNNRGLGYEENRFYRYQVKENEE